MNKKDFIGLSSLLLVACSNGMPQFEYSNAINGQIETTEKIFIGVPTLLSFEGSSVRLNSDWVLTAAHNKPILIGREAYYHPVCDIALVKSAGAGGNEVGKVYQYEQLIHVGYPFSLPVSVSSGKYIGEVLTSDREDCAQSASTGVIMSGMSGGGVFNTSGELVGVNVGFVNTLVKWSDHEYKSPAVFISLNAVKDWICETSGDCRLMESQIDDIF